MAKWSRIGIAALARAVAFFALWVLLVDATDEPNLIAGGVCAVLAAGLATMTQTVRSVHVRVRPAMLRYGYRPAMLLVTDTARVTHALFARAVLRRSVRGKFRAVRYRATSGGSEDAGRRVLTIWAASVAANRYAIGVDRRRNVLIIHELSTAPGPLDPLELG